MNKYLVILLLFGIVGCANFQVIDKYGDEKIERYYHERGCFNMQVLFDVEQAYISECLERGLPQSYITGFTLGIADLIAAQYKFENALLAYLKEEHKLENCKIYRANKVEIMGDTQGVEAYYECDNKPKKKEELINKETE